MATSAASKRSSKKKADARGSISRVALARARKLAPRYRILLEQEEGGDFFGTVLEMRGVMGDGPTADACVAATRDALVTALAHLINKGEEPPPPGFRGSENNRTEQVNVRLTPTEKLLLEDAARREGFRGVSDLVRRTTLARITDVDQAE